MWLIILLNFKKSCCLHDILNSYLEYWCQYKGNEISEKGQGEDLLCIFIWVFFFFFCKGGDKGERGWFACFCLFYRLCQNSAFLLLKLIYLIWQLLRHSHCWISCNGLHYRTISISKILKREGKSILKHFKITQNCHLIFLRKLKLRSKK